MSEKVVKINIDGPESLVISKEERYELIAQVARALEERRQAAREEYDDYGYENEESVFDFSNMPLNFN
jgi:sRNA-binding carbon storage regulator CsrA